jgi:hypothetical protein
METEVLLPCSQEPATGPYPELHEPSSRTHVLFYLRSILLLSPMYEGVSKSFWTES